MAAEELGAALVRTEYPGRAEGELESLWRRSRSVLASSG